jgi:hypothetical protein
MNRTIFTCISFALCAAAIGQTGSAQSSDDSIDNSSSPAAYIYVSRPTHVDGFAAASNGKLTAVSGSPFANIAISHMSVTKKFLFGAGDDSQTLFTYSIASNGSLKQVASLDAQAYNSSNCGGMGPITIDQTGSTLYNIVNNDCDDLIQAYKIESNGSLKYVGSTDSGIGTDLFVVGPLTFLGSNNYAYQWGCGGDSFPAGGLIQYKRQSNGILVAESYPTLPSPENTNDIYCPEAIASDPSDHMAVAAMEYDEYFDQIPPSLLVDYTTSSNGTLTTKSTYKNCWLSAARDSKSSTSTAAARPQNLAVSCRPAPVSSSSPGINRTTCMRSLRMRCMSTLSRPLALNRLPARPIRFPKRQASLFCRFRNSIVMGSSAR